MKRLLLLLLLILSSCQPNPPAGGTFSKTIVARKLDVPWDLVFAPNGVLYFTERVGNVRALKPGDDTPTLLSHSLNIHVQSESGLMGLALDPQFSANARLYLCYSYSVSSGIANRVSRLTRAGDSLINETILLDAIPGNGNHNGCRLAFGPDGNLYASTGDAEDLDFPQDTSSLAGKILRINPDGSIPADNPFGNAVWSYGHRNPQGLTFSPDGKLFSTEHGPNNDDEINLIEKGRNYGWPEVEGLCDSAFEENFCTANNVAEPIIAYTPTLAVAGLDVYEGSVFPEWQGGLLFTSLKASQLRVLSLNADGSLAEDKLILDGIYGRLRDVEVAPDGKVYIATSNKDGRAGNGFPKASDDAIVRLDKQ